MMRDIATSPWQVEETDFPAHADSATQWQFLLTYAILAPSSHNTQPWHFMIRGDTLQIFADPRRALPIIDPNQRELMISCGSALFHLQLALWHFGYTDVVEILPDPTNPNLLAQLQIGDTRIATAEEHYLFRAIPQRHTYRAPFKDRPIPASVRADLQMAALSEGAWLHPLDGTERTTVAAFVAEGTRQQWADAQFRDELAAWICAQTAREGHGDYSLGLTPLVMRSFDLGLYTAAYDQHLAHTAPLLAVLGTPHDRPEDWLHAGQALARVLLLATANNLAASFLNQPIEVPSLRARLQTLVGRPGIPQLMLRFGVGSRRQATARRPVQEVINRM